MPDDQEEVRSDVPGRFYAAVLKVTVVTAIIGAFTLFVLFLASEWSNPVWEKIAFDHFVATIGLPVAAAGAFVVCSVFRTTDGKVRFKILGLEFEGAAGPIIMWVLCFLAIATATRMLWPLGL